jgi:hypothetical protein
MAKKTQTFHQSEVFDFLASCSRMIQRPGQSDVKRREPRTSAQREARYILLIEPNLMTYMQP